MELVQALCVSAPFDHLLSRRLVTLEERDRLRQCSTEQERARMLLCDVFRYKENVVDRFFRVLQEAGQLHIVS